MGGGESPRRHLSGTALVVVSVVLALVASAIVAVAPTTSVETWSGFVERPPGAVGVSVRERTTEGGERVVRVTVTYRSGRKEVKEYRTQPDIDRTTRLAHEPATTIAVILLALGVAAFPLLLNGPGTRQPARAVAASLLAIGAVVGAASVGLLYLPSAIAMAIAAIRG